MAASGLGLVARFFGRTISEAAAFGAGAALGPVLGPPVRELKNAVNAAYPFEPLSAGTAAGIAAERVDELARMRQEASYTGIDAERFNDLYGEALNAPDLALLFEDWRRDLISDGDFEHGLQKAKLEPRWFAPLKGLKQRLLTLSDLANARQQQFIDTARQHSESALQGLDAERADILFKLAGLPPGVDVMQFAVNRGLADRAEFDQAIAEGHTKTKYTDLLWAMRRPVLSAPEYATLHLKGWLTVDEMNAGGALHGFTPEQMHLLYLARGRPAAPGQMSTAVARGALGPDGAPMDKPQFLKGIRQSDIRPEYGEMLWEIRFTYPPLFQVNRLVQSGAITPAVGEEWLHKNRLAPEVVQAFADYWTAGTGASAVAPEVKSAHTRALLLLRNAYVARRVDDAFATDRLTALGIAPDVQGPLLDAWRIMQTIPGAGLTRAQVKKAFKSLPAEWPRDRALTELEDLGMEPEEAQTYLDE